MVLGKNQTTVAYKCPHCGTLVMSLVGAFALSADMIKLKCPCGESELSAVYTKDRKIRLTVPCFACPNPHSYVVTPGVFFTDELFRIPCAVSGLDICYCGREDLVRAAADETDRILRELLGDVALESLAAARGEDEQYLSDPQVREIVTYVVQDLASDGGIHCGCEDGESDLLIEVGDVTVTVTCKRCGRMAVIPADSLTGAEDFLGAESLELT